MGLSERFVLTDQRVIPLDRRQPPEIAMLSQPLGTAIFALRKLPNLLDLNVVVVGQGPMGQIFNACLRNLGARQIIGIDRVAGRLEMSPRMGATTAIDATRDDPVGAVARLTADRMADVVIEAVGHANQALNLCIDLCGQEGILFSFGVPPEVIDSLQWRRLFFKNVKVHTSVNPDFNRDFPLAMRWISEKRIDLSPLITHRFPLRRIQQAYETFRDRKDEALKVLVEFPSNSLGSNVPMQH
jgi:threonine dehydrogenase-like Zn-dependent dehydrogenase